MKRDFWHKHDHLHLTENGGYTLHLHTHTHAEEPTAGDPQHLGSFHSHKGHEGRHNAEESLPIPVAWAVIEETLDETGKPTGRHTICRFLTSEYRFPAAMDLAERVLDALNNDVADATHRFFARPVFDGEDGSDGQG